MIGELHPLNADSLSSFVKDVQVARFRRCVVATEIALLNVGAIALPVHQLPKLLHRWTDPTARCETILGIVAGREISALRRCDKVDGAWAPPDPSRTPTHEDMPTTICLCTINFSDLFLLRLPDILPCLECPPVADAHVCDALDLKASALKVFDDPTHWRGRVGTRKHM